MKLKGVKAVVAKVMTVGLLAGAFAAAVPEKAQAQQFAVGVQFGAPRYDYAPRAFDRRFEARREREEIARRVAWERELARRRHNEWVRSHEAGRFGFGYNGR